MLIPGTQLGPYEIVGPIGAGGMGEVYRARDAKLGRDVALKVLPDAFAAETDRLARFEREAKLLASLNHPNIAAIYGFEDSAGAHALVMELVEGETLAERIAKGPMPVDEALAIATQICEGLEYAHERGIIHRDLKPANVNVTPQGTVKLLDFGLAKALEGEPIAGDISHSPTISRLATQAGIILGTASYMSPEQAKGKPVDRRADIWGFGCLLYEMSTGKPSFTGETVTDILASVVKEEPDWSRLPPATPPPLRRLLRRCLTKDHRQRLRDIGEARITLEEVLTGTAQPELAASAGAEPPPRRPWRRSLPWAIAAVLGLTVALLVAAYFLRVSPEPSVVAQIEPPAATRFLFTGAGFGAPALSPDGRLLVFSALGADGRQQLWLRALDSSTTRAVEGTDGATFPFWSPDSRSIGFFANGKLYRSDVAGGPPLPLCPAGLGRGGSWGSDGTILFSPNVNGPVLRISALGGTPQPAAKLGPNESSHRWPQFLPDNRHFLFFTQSTTEDAAVYAASLDGADRKLILRNTSDARYVAPGYLLFVRDGTLMAQRFDAARLSFAGGPIPLAGRVAEALTVSMSLFSASENGMLVYESGGATFATYHLLWFDRAGKQIGETGAQDRYADPRISPDGRRLVSALVSTGGTANLWSFDLRRGIKTRLTFSNFAEREPVWSPDGRIVAFESAPSGSDMHVYQHPADGTGTTTPLLVEKDATEYQPVFSADGRYLLYQRLGRGTNERREIWAVPLVGDRTPFPVVRGQGNNIFPALSSNGKWLAYASGESGVLEIYVVPFRNGSGRWQVSTNGGNWPRWREDGKELFYLSPDNKMMSAEIDQRGSSVVIGKVAPLFPINPFTTSGWAYDVSGDGRKFVVVSQSSGEPYEPLTLVVNWPELLKK